jgi:hypothetical protein
MATKDSLFFRHDYNARNDRKIAALVKKHKSAGYGIFWITCEMMHEEGGQIEFDDITFGALAKDANEEISLVKSVISDCITEFKLFKRDNDIVISGRVSRNLEWKQSISNSRANAGKRGAIAKQMSGNSQQKKERKKEDSGFEFSADGLGVIFQDGTFQEFGQSQLLRFKHGDIKPEEITKGIKI